MEGDVPHPSIFCRCQMISIHSLRMEGDGITIDLRFTEPIFQSTPSAWRETSILPGDSQAMNHFNPLPPHGGRRVNVGEKDLGLIFQSTPSAWRETLRPIIFSEDFIFQSTPSAWRETKVYGISGNVDLNISIHSLRMEGDDDPIF